MYKKRGRKQDTKMGKMQKEKVKATIRQRCMKS